MPRVITAKVDQSSRWRRSRIIRAPICAISSRFVPLWSPPRPRSLSSGSDAGGVCVRRASCFIGLPRQDVSISGISHGRRLQRIGSVWQSMLLLVCANPVPILHAGMGIITNGNARDGTNLEIGRKRCQPAPGGSPPDRTVYRRHRRVERGLGYGEIAVSYTHLTLPTI